MVRVQRRIDEIIQRRREAPQRSNSTKVSALSMMKGGMKTKDVSVRLGIPMRTLQSWKKAAIKAGTWTGPGGDSGLARPAPRKTDPGSGFASRKVNYRMKRRMKNLLKINRS